MTAVTLGPAAASAAGAGCGLVVAACSSASATHHRPRGLGCHECPMVRLRRLILLATAAAVLGACSTNSTQDDQP
jgi:hypothetical protein